MLPLGASRACGAPQLGPSIRVSRPGSCLVMSSEVISKYLKEFFSALSCDTLGPRGKGGSLILARVSSEAKVPRSIMFAGVYVSKVLGCVCVT